MCEYEHLSKHEIGDLLEVPIWRALENSMRTSLEGVKWGDREPYVRATLRADDYAAKWLWQDTSKKRFSRPDFTVLKRDIPLLNIEAHNLNPDFLVCYRWHRKNTLSRFKQPAEMGYLVTSCYNPTITDMNKIFNSLHRRNITLITLGRQIRSEKDMLAASQIEEKLRPYLSKVFKTSTHEICLIS